MSKTTRQQRTEDEAFDVDAEIAAYTAKVASPSGLAEVPALSAFQRQLNAYPQLSPKGQLEMIQRVRAGREAEDSITRARSDRRIAELRGVIKEGRKAANYLVGSNFRLVLLICSEKAKDRYGIERTAAVMPDLVGEANIALAEAIEYYDEAKCPVFATYVARVVRDRVQYSLSKEGAVRAPSSWNRVKRIAAVRIPKLEAELGRVPTDAEIKADILTHCESWAASKLTEEQRRLPKEKRNELITAKLRKQGTLGAIESLSEVRVLGQSVASLDAPVGSEGTGTLGEMIADDTDEMFDSVEFSDLQNVLAGALGDLGERDREIIFLRFGFVGDGDVLTYAAIGEKYGISAERVRQVERAVLDRLSTDENLRSALASYLPSLG